MPQDDKDKPATLRFTINAVRRRNGIIKMAILLIPIGLLVCWISTGRPELGEYLIIFMFIDLGINFLIDRSDRCPQCNRNISSLQDQGHFLFPRLSRQVHVCPYCGADFDGINTTTHYLTKRTHAGQYRKHERNHP
jgi:hypothetical protein